MFVLGLRPPPLPQTAFWRSCSWSDCARIHYPACPVFPEARCKISIMNQRWAVQSCLIPVFCHNLCFFQISIVVLWSQTMQSILPWNKWGWFEGNFSVLHMLEGKSLAEAPQTAEQGWVICFLLGWAFRSCAPSLCNTLPGDGITAGICICGWGTEEKNSKVGTGNVSLELEKAAKWTTNQVGVV